MKKTASPKSIGKKTKTMTFVRENSGSVSGNQTFACEFSGLPSILEVAIANNVPLNHSCGGMGSCTTCRVHVIQGAEKLGERNEVEAEHAHMRGYAKNERLSCQTTAEDGIVCRIPPGDDDQ